MIYVRVKVVIFRCQVRTHPPSDGLHFIVMDANPSPNKGPAPELTLSQIFEFEHEDIPNSGLNFESMLEDFNMQNSQPPSSLPEPVREIQETRIVDSDLEGQNRTTLDDELDRNLPFQLPLASGPAELPWYVTDHGFGFTVEDIPITGWPNLQQPWSENIGELDFPLVAEGPGMQNSQLHYSGDGKIYRSPQLHAFLKTSGILSISKGDFPHVLEEDISIPELPNPQLPNSGAWNSSPTAARNQIVQPSHLQAAQNQIAQPSHLSLGNNGFTSQLLQSNYSQTARDGTSNFPLINGGDYVGPNHHVAPSSGPPQRKTAKKSHKSYSVQDRNNLVREVAIHGQKWKSIAKSFPQRSKEQLKQKWRDMMEKAGTKMDENKKRLHIFAAVVHINIKKTSKYKQKFQKWFEEMEKEDREIKAYAEAWFRKVKNAPSSPLQN